MRNPAKTRTCASCGKKAPKGEFIRIGKADNIVDIGGIGRGAYLCKNKDCLQKAIKKKRLASVLRCAVPDEVYEKILNTIGSDED